MNKERTLSYKLATILSKEDLHQVNAAGGSEPTLVITFGANSLDTQMDVS